MICLAADENFNQHIIRALRRRVADFDVKSVQDASLAGADDDKVLAWAAQEGRVLLTHDLKTMPQAAYERLAAGAAMPGMFAVSWSAPTNQIIEDLLLLLECSTDEEWFGQILFLPL